jgi:hypothetical protein
MAMFRNQFGLHWCGLGPRNEGCMTLTGIGTGSILRK